MSTLRPLLPAVGGAQSADGRPSRGVSDPTWNAWLALPVFTKTRAALPTGASFWESMLTEVPRWRHRALHHDAHSRVRNRRWLLSYGHGVVKILTIIARVVATLYLVQSTPPLVRSTEATADPRNELWKRVGSRCSRPVMPPAQS